MLVFIINLSFKEFLVGYLALFLLFSVIYDFEWFWMESLHKNIQLLLDFLKAPFLVLHFSCYALMTFLTIAIYAGSELESDLRNNVDWGKKWLVDFNAGKTPLVSFDRSNNNGSIDRSNNNGSIDVKMNVSIL